MKNKDVYSPYKFAHHIGKLEDIKEGKIVAPVNLQLDPTNRCNSKCAFCFYDIHDLDNFSRRDQLGLEKIIGLLDDFKSLGGKSVEFTGGGEPLVHKDFDAMSAYAKGRGLERALVTNGILLDKHMDVVKDYSWVRISLNSASPGGYADVHNVNSKNFGRVVNNLEELCKVKTDDNVVGVSVVVYEKNWEDIFRIGKIAKSSGANNYRISLAHTDEGAKIFSGIWDGVIDQIEKTKELGDDEFRVFSFSNRINDIAKQTRGGFCFYHHLTTAVGANGDVYPCCYFKYDDKFKLGNVNEESFVDIWKGEIRQEFIDGVGKDCYASCWMTEKNKFAQYLTTDKADVPHLNFP
ncbi:MAG: hypothetical protein DRJ15_12580 [Bacteroidetes bacterium]|nr:MAG: hypothetical protein DRJ15_12580 [Bacteroidota bacterium]